MSEHERHHDTEHSNSNRRERRREAEPDEPSPTIYVASLADYVNGRLHGEWLSAAQPADELEAEIAAMLKRSPLALAGEVVEEWAIHDSDGFGNIRIGEHDDLSTVTEQARGIVEHGLAYAAWYDLNGSGSTPEGFLDDYIGAYDSLEDYARTCGDDFGWDSLLDEVVPSYLRAYVAIDYDMLARDMSCSGEVYTAERPDGGVWLFRG